MVTPHEPSERGQQLRNLKARRAPDVTRRLGFEDALRRSEAQFRQLADAMPQIAGLLQQTGHRLFQRAVVPVQRFVGGGEKRGLEGNRRRGLLKTASDGITHPCLLLLLLAVSARGDEVRSRSYPA